MSDQQRGPSGVSALDEHGDGALDEHGEASVAAAGRPGGASDEAAPDGSNEINDETDRDAGDGDGGEQPGRRRGLGLLGRLGLVALVLALGGAGTWVIVGATTPKAERTAQNIPALQVVAADVKPGSKAPKTVSLKTELPTTEHPTPTPKPQASSADDTAGDGDPLTAWAQRTAARTGIPERALWAYGNAELTMRSIEPGCHLSWTTLAGIGRIESNHGQYGGAVLEPNGLPSKPVVGVPLTGNGAVASVADTDGGQLDGDPRVDRAVGPMQLIPSTWRRWATDGNGDGKGNPQQIDDAAVTAARYLCAGGRDMSTPTGWWSGIMSYNNSAVYGQKVFGLANQYAGEAQ